MNQSVSVSLLPSTLPAGINWEGTCAIVLDVLRATSVMTTAGAHGARHMTTCSETTSAFAMAEAASERPLLCGERECRPIKGFDLGNSPAEYGPGVVGDRDLVITTTNGTRAVESVMASERMMVASFLNFSATVRFLSRQTDLQLLIVCAGTNGQISYEDVLLAGALVDALVGEGDVTIGNDSGRIAQDVWRLSGAAEQPTPDRITRALRRSLGGRNLIAAGYEDDLLRCAQIDRIDGVVVRASRIEPTFCYRTGH